MAHRVTGLLLILLLATGCASLPPGGDDIKVTLVNIQPLESTLLEQRYRVTLRLQNRTPRPLAVQGMSFDIDLNHKSFGSGVSNQALEVAPFDDGLFEVKMSSTLFGILRQIQSLQQAGRQPFHYRISGRVSSPASLISIPFEEQGEIDLTPSNTRPVERPAPGEELQPAS